MSKRKSTKKRSRSKVAPTTLGTLHVALCEIIGLPQLRARQLGPTVDLLGTDEQIVPNALIGMALWNLLPAIPERTDPPKAFRTLLRSVLNLEFEEAVRSYKQSPNDVFPPFPEQLVRESSRHLKENAGTVSGTLEVTVDRSFEKLKSIVIPASWPHCNVFWSKVDGLSAKAIPTDDSWSRSEGLTGHLRLPAGKAEPEPVSLDVHIGVTPFEARTDFVLEAPRRFETCRGFLRVKKEPGRPGTSRVTAERVVRWADRHGLAPDMRLAAVDYWLRAEIACLALSHNSTRGPA